jgi:hypothetical protein
MSIHCYSKWNCRWGYWPIRYPHADYEIMLNGKWTPVRMGRENRRDFVIGHQFVEGKWQ